MSYENRREVRRQLQCESRRQTCRQRLKYLQAEFPVFQTFHEWVEVFRHLLDASVSPQTKDEILCALIWTIQHESAPELNAVLILAFWPALSSIAAECGQWDAEPGEFWANLQWAFFETIHRVDAIDQPLGIAGAIRNAVRDRLRTQYRREWSYKHHEGTPLSPQHLARVGETGDSEHRALGILAKRRLKRALRQGRLTREEFDLLMAVDYIGVPLVEYARTAGIGYEAAKKRHQRAIAKIRHPDRKK